MKTMEQWETSNLDFTRFCEPGENIDKAIYDYFLGVVPPVKVSSTGFLVGEPMDSHGSEFRYMAFYHSPKRYGGLKTKSEF